MIVHNRTNEVSIVQEYTTRLNDQLSRLHRSQKDQSRGTSDANGSSANDDQARRLSRRQESSDGWGALTLASNIIPLSAIDEAASSSANSISLQDASEEEEEAARMSPSHADFAAVLAARARKKQLTRLVASYQAKNKGNNNIAINMDGSLSAGSDE